MYTQESDSESEEDAKNAASLKKMLAEFEQLTSDFQQLRLMNMRQASVSQQAVAAASPPSALNSSVSSPKELQRPRSIFSAEMIEYHNHKFRRDNSSSSSSSGANSPLKRCLSYSDIVGNQGDSCDEEVAKIFATARKVNK